MGRWPARHVPVSVEVLTSPQLTGGYPVLGADALLVSSSASDRLHRIRVIGPTDDPRSIRVAERQRMGRSEASRSPSD
jgi:hypothetical protein